MGLKEVMQKEIELDIVQLKEFLLIEMNWNGPSIKVLFPDFLLHNNLVELEIGLKPGEWSKGLLYSCMPGSSVIKELREAITKFHPDLKFKIVRSGDTSRRAFEHDYLLIQK